MKNKLIILFCLFSKVMVGQVKPWDMEIEAQATGTTSSRIPFWMRSNQYGNTPTYGLSGSFLGRAKKEYNGNSADLLDWGVGFEGRFNTGKRSEFKLIEGYGKVKAGIFQIKAGRYKHVVGLNGDTALTSGNFAISGNALGVPSLSISIPEYWSLPILDNLVSIKGSYSHGWLGTLRIQDTVLTREDGSSIVNKTNRASTYLHEKSFYVRLGREDTRAKLYGGFNHQVFWGNEAKIYGENFDLSTIETLLYVTIGKTYEGKDIPRSKIGNQLGSIDLAAEYGFDNVKVMVYRQNFYDVGALSKLANIRDGLNGVTIENKNFGISGDGIIQWKKVLLELLSTKHQAGVQGAKLTKSGDEDYYNNYFYLEGWSYRGVGLGTPFISPKHTVRNGLPSHPKDYFINNRVVALHAGIQGSIASWNLLLKTSFSQNFGTFGTSKEGHSTGAIKEQEPLFGLFGRKNQFSAYLESDKRINSTTSIGGAIAIDRGQLLDNSYGFMFKLSKKIK